MSSTTKRRSASLRPAIDPEALTREELRRLAKVERNTVSAGRPSVVAGQREVQEIDLRRRARVEAQRLEARLAETAALARARGEEVRAESVRIAAPLFDDQGVRVIRHGLPVYRQEAVTRVRVVSRGGLQLAFERGDLDGGRGKSEHLLDVGRAYRWAFETTASLKTPARDLAPVLARGPVRASSGPQEAVFAAGELLRILRNDLTRRQVAVLDQVCGLDASISAAAVALQADPRTVRRILVEALTLAEANRRGARDHGPRRYC